jgi:hypothetical protein
MGTEGQAREEGGSSHGAMSDILSWRKLQKNRDLTAGPERVTKPNVFNVLEYRYQMYKSSQNCTSRFRYVPV